MLIAFHYPPIQVSSGVHRALAFSRHLPEFGWDVTVLTVNARAHESVRSTNLGLTPAGVNVIRAQAWDAARHFSIAGRYPSVLALPDRWSSWIPFGVVAGLRAIRTQQVEAIFSTFPIVSAHLVARTLHRMTGLPWIADFRDPMVSAAFPPQRAMRRRWERIQASVMSEASRITVTTPGAAEYYRGRFPNLEALRVSVIENGFDPELFEEPQGPAATLQATSAPLVLLHSGGLYRQDRDPTAFFRALRTMIDKQVIDRRALHIRLRASGFEDEYSNILNSLGLTDVVSLAPPVGYREAASEMQTASALLLFQGATCNSQIPAKVYEYLYAGRPIIGLTDPRGDTGRLLASFGISGVAALEDETSIVNMLSIALPKIRSGGYPIPSRDAVMGLSRRAGTVKLAVLLDQLVAERRAH